MDFISFFVFYSLSFTKIGQSKCQEHLKRIDETHILHSVHMSLQNSTILVHPARSMARRSRSSRSGGNLNCKWAFQLRMFDLKKPCFDPLSKRLSLLRKGLKIWEEYLKSPLLYVIIVEAEITSRVSPRAIFILGIWEINQLPTPNFQLHQKE